MKKLLTSTVFQFSFMILAGSAAAAAFSDGLTWSQWLSEAVIILGIYASKEGVRYGAEAYGNKDV